MILGLVSAIILYRIGEHVNFQLHPFPDSIDITDREKLKIYLDDQPQSLWVVILCVWSLGSFVAGYIIKQVCRSQNLSLPLIAGCILTVIGTKNVFDLPHPVWFTWASFITFIPLVLVGYFSNRVKLLKTR